jgi:hypothetical protein
MWIRVHLRPENGGRAGGSIPGDAVWNKYKYSLYIYIYILQQKNKKGLAFWCSMWGEII